MRKHVQMFGAFEIEVECLICISVVRENRKEISLEIREIISVRRVSVKRCKNWLVTSFIKQVQFVNSDANGIFDFHNILVKCHKHCPFVFFITKHVLPCHYRLALV